MPIKAFIHEDEIDHPVGKELFRFSRITKIYEFENRGSKENIESIILGHLLIEEILTKCIEIKAPNTKQLKEVKLTFHQKIYLVKAMYNHNLQPDWKGVWRSIVQLNEIRNLIAHNLEPKNLDLEIDKLLDYVERIDAMKLERNILDALSRMHRSLVALIDPKNRNELLL